MNCRQSYRRYLNQSEMENSTHGNLLLWGGIECTINRVGDHYYDQLSASGHYKRETDIDNIASLGIKALRYPVLWEKHQPDTTRTIDWSWITRQFEKIRSYNITPIAGLLHHGSGPRFTDLLDEQFPKKLAAYADKVARQFPWLEYYTPVNEPLTTARFSGLYGHWYPHKCNDVVFANMLLNQVKGIVLAMHAIRIVNPSAKLVQTEDLSKTYSTKLLQYQADFENNRRWLTYDLLTGKLLPGHPMWDYFLRLGIPPAQLYFFAENSCPPDIAGVNYYVTSERYIDHRSRKYPPTTHGSNDIHHYADVEAVRVQLKEPSGFSVLAREFWNRYNLPVAITEAHLGCSVDEQLRWFDEIWHSANDLANGGVNIIAVTAWALLGSYGWNKLLTQGLDHYESGVFRLEHNRLNGTELSNMITTLAAGGDYANPLLAEKGWWKKTTRLFHPPAARKNKMRITAAV